MKQGSSTVIGLLTFLLVATFGAAAYFVSRAYSAQNAQAKAFQLVENQREKTTELEQIVKRLESEWRIAATESENAVEQVKQLRGLVDDQDQEIEYLIDNLQTVSNQLVAAATVEANLNHRLAQLDLEKKEAVELAASLRDQLKALENEFENVKNQIPLIVPVDPPHIIVGKNSPKDGKVSQEKLEAKNHNRSLVPQANPPSPQPLIAEGISGTVREVNAKFGFAILDVGAPNGVKPGDKFSVSRGNEHVGKLRVRKLHSGLSVCDIIAEETSGVILQGDQVKQLR